MALIPSSESTLMHGKVLYYTHFEITGDPCNLIGTLQGVSKVRGHFKKSILYPDFLYFSPFSCRY